MAMNTTNEEVSGRFENIFITTIKTDSVNVNLNGVETENGKQQNKIDAVDKERVTKVTQHHAPAMICKSIPRPPQEHDQLVTEDLSKSFPSQKLTVGEGVGTRKCVNTNKCTPFNVMEVLADLKFCVPKSGIEKKTKLDEDEDRQTTSIALSKTRILKIRKRRIPQNAVKDSLKKPWKKKYSGRPGERVAELKADKDPFCSSPVVTAHMKWQSPEEMRTVFEKICQVCYSYHGDDCLEDGCPLLRPSSIIHHDPDSLLGYELPRDFLLGYSRVYIDRLSLFARNFTPKLTQFGPLKGHRFYPGDLSKLCLPDVDLDHFWPVRRTNKAHDYLCVDEYIDTKDASLSNWCRFLVPEHSSALCAGDDSPLKANVQRVLRENDIYFVTTRDIRMGEELFMRCLEPPERIYFNLNAMASSNSSSLNKTKVKVLLDDCSTCKGKLQEKFPFPSILRMVRHRRMMHNTLPAMCDFANIFHCNFCGMEFRFQTELRKHRNEHHLIHDKQHNTQCQYCKIYKKSVDALSGHVSAVHFVSSDHPVTCTICGLQFPTHGKYQQHRVNEHRPEGSGKGGEGGNTCSLCGKTFKTYSTLKKHVWKVHEKKDYRVCETCGKSFKDKYQLRVHSLTHSGIKPFQCDADGCTAAFTTKQWLQKHYRSAHNFTDHTMPQIRRKVDFSDEAMVPEQDFSVKKVVNNQKNIRELCKTESGSAMTQAAQTAENNQSQYPHPIKPQSSNMHMINDNINANPSSVNPLNEITSLNPDYSDRGIPLAAQGCLPHFAPLPHNMALQNAPLAPRAPLVQPFTNHQIAPDARWTQPTTSGAHNQPMTSQGVFDSGYYSMHDFY